MSVTLYEATVPTYLRMLRNLEAMLDRAEAHAEEKGLELSAFTEARLIADMHPFVRQIQIASDAAKGGAARLAGVTPPSYEDVETTFPELRERIAKTIAFVESLDPEQFDGDDDRQIDLPVPGRTLGFTAREFAIGFSIPNFLFHVVTAYGLLRAQGVPLGKLDYLAGLKTL